MAQKSSVGETGMIENLRVGKTGVGKMGVGEMGIPQIYAGLDRVYQLAVASRTAPYD